MKTEPTFEELSVGFGPSHDTPVVPEHPLFLCRLGERVTISSCAGGHELAKRLETMGLRPGTTVEVLQRTDSGAVILACGDTRLGIDQQVAGRVRVRPALAEPVRETSQTTANEVARLPWPFGKRVRTA